MLVFFTYTHSQTIESDVNIFCFSKIWNLYCEFFSIKFIKLAALEILVHSTRSSFISQVVPTIQVFSFSSGVSMGTAENLA
jgi:hypothetical protein